jgi:drug/metabolite transporter (DMT)-like permease
VLALGVVGTGLAYVLNHRLIADEGAAAASTVTYLIPVVAVALGAIALNELLTWNLFLGALIALVGIALSEGMLITSSLGSPKPRRSTLVNRG